MIVQKDFVYNAGHVDDLHMRVGIDSCAANSVLPKNMCTDYPLVSKPDGKVYRGAKMGSTMKDMGAKAIAGTCTETGREAAFKFRVLDVTRPLASVAKMVDDGMRIVFEKVNGVDKSYIHNPVNDTTTPMTRQNNTYSIGLTVPKYSQKAKKKFHSIAREHWKSSKEQGFPRRA